MSSESTSMKMGAIGHVEIAAVDLDSSKAFFSKYFGWEFQDMGDSYAMFDSGTVGGALDCDIEPTINGTVIVLTVPDVKEMLATFEANGVEILKGYTEIAGGFGYYAYFKDPAGNKLGIWSKTPSK